MVTLNKRRQAHRLTLMYKISHNHIDINRQEYLQEAITRNTRNSHTQKYQTYQTNTDSYKHTYFTKTIKQGCGVGVGGFWVVGVGHPANSGVGVGDPEILGTGVG